MCMPRYTTDQINQRVPNWTEITVTILGGLHNCVQQHSSRVE